jgi:hypothetical protein
MSKFLININDGTVCDLAGTVVVDTDKLDEAGKELLHDWQEGGNDDTATELGSHYGTLIEKFVNNDLTYSNTIAFSGQALRDEVRDRLESGYTAKEYLLANEFTDEQFEELGQYILQSEYLWEVFNEELRDGIRNYTNDILKGQASAN